MFLRIEYSASAVHTDAPVRLLPLAVYEVHLDVRFAVMALESYALD